MPSFYNEEFILLMERCFISYCFLNPDNRCHTIHMFFHISVSLYYLLPPLSLLDLYFSLSLKHRNVTWLNNPLQYLIYKKLKWILIFISLLTELYMSDMIFHCIGSLFTCKDMSAIKKFRELEQHVWTDLCC